MHTDIELRSSAPLRLSSSTNDLYNNQLYTVRFILTNLIDLSFPLTRTLITRLLEFCNNEEDKQKLLSIGHLKDPEYHLQITQEFKSALELLEEFRSIQIGLAELIEFLPKLKPRFYSISSSALENPNTAHLTGSCSVLGRAKNVMKREKEDEEERRTHKEKRKEQREAMKRERERTGKIHSLSPLVLFSSPLSALLLSPLSLSAISLSSLHSLTLSLLSALSLHSECGETPLPRPILPRSLLLVSFPKFGKFAYLCVY